MKIKLLLFALLVLFVLPFRSYAACTFSVNGTTNTVSSSCSFDNQIDGIDMGTTAVVNGQTVPVNTSVLRIANGTVTIGATQQIAIGSINLTGGSLAIIAGGKMLLNTPMWYNDSDNDGAFESTIVLARTLPSVNAVRINTTTPSSFDCNTTSNLVSIPHAQCYTDADGDAYTNGLAANTTCLSHSTCALSTSSSASTNGAAVTTTVAGRLRDAANGADCNDGSNLVYTAHAQCYTDADGDAYTNGLAANTTCLNAATCAAATRAGASTNGAGTTAYTAGRLRDAVGTADCNDANAALFRTVAGYLDSDGDTYGAGTYTTCAGAAGSYVASNTDCYDSNANAKPGQTVYYASVRGDASYDYNCDSVETKSPAPIASCSSAGCAAHYFTTVTGWVTAAPACGAAASWKTHVGGAACTTYVAGAGTTCPAGTISSVTQSCR